MGKHMRIKTAPKGNRAPLLGDGETSRGLTDLEEGSNVQPANVGFCRVIKLAKHDAGKLVIATMALLVASLINFLVSHVKHRRPIFLRIHLNYKIMDTLAGTPCYGSTWCTLAGTPCYGSTYYHTPGGNP